MTPKASLFGRWSSGAAHPPSLCRVQPAPPTPPRGGSSVLILSQGRDGFWGPPGAGMSRNSSHQRPRAGGAEGLGQREGLEHIFLPSRQVHEVALPSTASQVTAEAAKHLREASSDLQKPQGPQEWLSSWGPSTGLCPFPFLDCPYSLTLSPQDKTSEASKDPRP